MQCNENLLAEKMNIYLERISFSIQAFPRTHIQRESRFGRKTKFMDRKFGIDERFDTEIRFIKKSHGKLNHFRIVKLYNKNSFST